MLGRTVMSAIETEERRGGVHVLVNLVEQSD